MTELLAVIGLTLLAVVSPGPDFAMVSRNSLLLSRRAGVLTALGIGGGCCVHVGYTILGIGMIVRQSALLFGCLKLAGAAYLIWLGWTMLRARPAALPDRVRPLGSWAALRTGFLTNALNPKTTVFIVSLFMQAVQPATPLTVQLGYGLFIVAAHIGWFVLVALFFSAERVQARLLAARPWIDRGFGSALIGFGVLLVASGA